MKRVATLTALLMLFCGLEAQLIQHLDATIVSSVSLDAKDLVTAWLDQSGEGNDAADTLGELKYVVPGGDEPGWIDFGDSLSLIHLFNTEESDRWLDQSAVSAEGFCVLIAFQVNGFVDNWNDLFGNSTAVGSGFGLRYSKSGSIQGYLGGNTINKGGENLAAGDRVVYAFNYNAASGMYEFWDSKNNSSVTGTVAAADFSLNAPVTLGATAGGGRYIRGRVGEAKIFDSSLSPSDFQAERDSMGVRWADLKLPVTLNWWIVPDDERFPTEDAILSAISVKDKRLYTPLPSDPENEDCTGTFEEAIDLVRAAGGGTVFVPEGIYRLDGTLNIPVNVTLRGRWRPLSETEPAIGSILKVYYGRGSEEGDAFINVSGSAGIRELTFWYPEQDPENIVPYPFVIASNGGPITIENITLVNAYKGVNMSSASMCFIDNIQGTALHTGFFADKSYAVSRFDKLNFGPEFWRWSGLQDDQFITDGYEQHMLNSGLGIDIREMDGFHLTDSKVRGMKTGLQFDVGVTGDNPHGDMAGMDLRDCQVGLKIVSSKGLKIVNSYFHGTEAGLLDLYTGSVKANNCTFSGGNAALESRYGGKLGLGSCVFDGKTVAAGTFLVAGSVFQGSGVNIELTPNTSSALIIGCSFPNGKNIVDNTNSTTRVIIDDSNADPRYSPSPLLPPKDLSINRKPAKKDVFNIVDYGAMPNDGSDDSDAFALAIEDANANQGGVVFIPSGIFDLSGNFTIHRGVELRGASGSRHKSQDGDPHTLVQITGGEGDPDGAPFITLLEGSGIRGISFYYPSQKASMILPETLFEYPFTVRGAGRGVYITDCMFVNPYQAVHFKNADDHLLENCFMGGLNKTILVQNCDGGRVENFHLKPDFWRDLKMGDYPVTGTGTSQLKRYCGKYLHGIWLENSTNQVVFNIFNHASHQFFRADNSTGIGFMIGGEQLQRGYRFSGSEDFSLVLPIGNINNQGDRSGSMGVWTDPDFSGTVQGWLCGIEGCADETFRIESGKVHYQQSVIGGPGGRGVVNMTVKENGVLELDGFSFDRSFGYAFEEGCEVSIMDSEFDDIPNSFIYDGNVQLERNIFDKSQVVADANQNWFVNQGLKLNTADLVLEDSPMFGGGEYDARTISGARSSTDRFEIEVVDKDFLYGNNNPIEIQTYYYVDTDCRINIYYSSESGRKMGKSSNYTGAASPGYERINFTVDDALFKGEEDIVIEVDGESPLLNFVMLTRDISKINQAPVWAADTILQDTIKVDSVYSAELIVGTDVMDPEGDHLYFSKTLGPAWLLVGGDGSVNGTPGKDNEGRNTFRIAVSDGNGNKVTAAVLLEVIEEINLAPEWSADTLYFKDAAAGELYRDTIRSGSDVADPEDDGISFTLGEGPAWLGVTSSGALGGTPGTADAGMNFFRILAGDGNNDPVPVVVGINVVDETNVSSARIQSMLVYPTPTKNFIKVEGAPPGISYGVFDLSGVQLLEGKLDNGIIEIESLAPGNYLLKIGYVVFNVVKI